MTKIASAPRPLIKSRHRLRNLPPGPRGWTSAALAAKKAQGVRLGNPTNIVEAGRLGNAAYSAQAEARKANVRPIIDSIRAAGVTTLKGIAKALNARGIRTARGGTWSPTQVSRIIA